tara:strand:- start:3358 stop:5616 length:2259 start_codon:yes stop_codon:yes gene_type:complete
MASFFDRFKSIINTKSQNTNEQYNRAIYNWLGNTIVWNTENDETYINDGYRKNATIYSLVNIITKAASTIPFHIYEKVNDNSYKRYKALSSGLSDANVMYKANMLKKHALVELEHTELHKLLERPNPAQSYASWISELIAFGKLTGNRYIYGIGPETGDNINKYTELYVMPSQIIEINSGGIMKPVESYTIEYNGTYKIPAEQMCHIKDFNPYYDGTGSHLYGQSPLKAGLRSMTTNNEATESGVKFLQNQTARGILMSDEGDLNEVQAQQLKDKFRRDHQGSKKAGDIIITPKKLSWVNFGLNASDMSLIEQYNASIKDLCNIYNVPVQLLNNTESSTYNNMKEAKKALYQNCVIPELIKIQDELNRWLAPMYGDNICIEYDFSVIPELQEETDKIVDQMSKAWWLTPNEKRAAMSYSHDEENSILDDYYIPANLIPVSGEPIDMPEPQPAETNNIDKMFNNNFINKEKIRAFVDAYTTRDEAEERAKEMGGNGSHTHTYDGETIFMPFKTHQEYDEALENNKYHYGKPHDDEDEYKAEVSSRVEKALKKKVLDHNDSVSAKSKKTSLGTLKKVFNRGVGAYNTNPSSVRPSVSSADQWAMARVNSYLYALKNGKFRGGKHDTDLLPEGHPMSSKKESKAEGYDDYPQSATNNAKRVKNWIDKYGRGEVDGMTTIGLSRMNQLIAREKLSLSVLKRTFSFLSRTKGGGYNRINPKFKDTPWRDKGYVAYLGWGGESMLKYAERKLNQLDNE